MYGCFLKKKPKKAAWKHDALSNLRKTLQQLQPVLHNKKNSMWAWLKSRWAWPSLIRIFTYPHGFWSLLATAVQITEGLLYSQMMQRLKPLQPLRLCWPCLSHRGKNPESKKSIPGEHYSEWITCQCAEWPLGY